MFWTGTTDVEFARDRLSSGWQRLAGEAKIAFGAAFALGLLLVSPCLTTGWLADDFFHQLMLRPDPGVAGLSYRPFDLFRFADGNPSTAHRLIDQGVFSWWADPHAVLAFFRPLSSFTHWLDYRLWPGSPVLMHLHSMAWFALLLTVVGVLYRQFSGRSGTAQLALLLFAIDDAHAPVVSWIANRNQIIALALALPALIAHQRFRANGFRAGVWLGPLLFGLGLLASESALIAGAYLVSFAAVLDSGSLRQRYGSLVPYAALVLVWRVAYGLLGYGAANSGLYVDPVRAPLAFIGALFERLPVLSLSQLALPWAELWEIYPLTAPWLRYAVGALAWMTLLGFGALLRPLWRENRSVRFFGVGALLALVPVCASFPHDRLLLGAGVGAMGVMAEVLRRAFQTSERAASRLTLGVFGGLHLLLAPLLLPYRAGHVNHFSSLFDAADKTIASTPEIAGKTVILVNPPLDPFAAYFPVYRQARGEPRPSHLLWLNSGVTELSITGVDETCLRVRAQAGFLSSATQLMLRDRARPPQVGETVELTSAAIRVTGSTDDGRPLEIEVRFREPLHSEHFLFFEWRGHGYVPFVPPAPGQSVTVPALDFASVLSG